MSKNHVEGLVILEYMRLGLVPYFPSKKTEANPFLQGPNIRKSKRKFRKIWKKAQNKYFSMQQITEGTFHYGYSHTSPSKRQMTCRKQLVFRYIKSKVINEM